jgi:hypothetical protein
VINLEVIFKWSLVAALTAISNCLIPKNVALVQKIS